MNLVTVAGIKLDRLFKSNSVFKRTLESYGSEKKKNVRFCLVNEIFLSSFYLYVNVLEQGGGDCGSGWPVVFWRKVGVWWSLFSG
jgi:hypothetical protein